MLVQGKEITLRHFKEKDVEAFFAFRSDPKVCEYQDFMLHSKDDAEKFVAEQSKAVLGRPGEWFQVAIALTDNDLLIGDCGVMFNSSEPRLVEIGYTLDPTFQSRGYASTAVSMLCRLLFDSYQVHKIKAVIDIRNVPSIKLAERVGFIQEGHLNKNYWDKKTGSWVDEILYGMLNEK